MTKSHLHNRHLRLKNRQHQKLIRLRLRHLKQTKVPKMPTLLKLKLQMNKKSKRNDQKCLYILNKPAYILWTHLERPSQPKGINLNKLRRSKSGDERPLNMIEESMLERKSPRKKYLNGNDRRLLKLKKK